MNIATFNTKSNTKTMSSLEIAKVTCIRYMLMY